MQKYSITLTYSDGRLSLFQDDFENKKTALDFCESMLLLNPSITNIHFENNLPPDSFEEPTEREDNGTN